MSKKITGLNRYEALYNRRLKTYPDGSKQLLVCDRPVFNPDRVELAGYECKPEREKKGEGGGQRRRRRARSKLKDYIRCNDFSYFITITLDGEKGSRTDYGQIIKRLNKWLDNRRQRRGLAYLLVPEYHRDGRRIHFHGLINDRLPVVDSGTVSVEGLKKPVKVSTYKRKYNGRRCHTVYNLPTWRLGFSTAIPLYGQRERVARYVAKYLEKDFTKVGGRYYLHSNNLRLPVVEYLVIDFSAFPGDVFGFPGVPHSWKSFSLSATNNN